MPDKYLILIIGIICTLFLISGVQSDSLNDVWILSACNVSPTPTPFASNVHQTTYFPHLVRIGCLDYLGKPIVDMNVSAVVIESTSPYAWLTDIFGINTNETQVTNTTLFGTTDSDGAIVFLMVENLKYRLDFSKPGASISQINYLYPKEGEYVYIFWTEMPSSLSDLVSIRFWNATNISDSDYMDLGIEYKDAGSTTDKLEFTVYDAKSDLLYNLTSTTPNSWNTSYPVLMGHTGASYIWMIRGNNTKFVHSIVQSQVIQFGYSNDVIRFTLCSDGSSHCIENEWLAVGIIFIVGMLCGRAVIKFGTVIIVLLTLLFTYIGWLGYTGLLLSTIMFFCVLLYLRFADQEGDS